MHGDSRKETLEPTQIRYLHVEAYMVANEVLFRGLGGGCQLCDEVSVLRQKIRDRDQQIVELKEELEANRFDQHLPAGQALMRKCKALLTENRELGGAMRAWMGERVPRQPEVGAPAWATISLSMCVRAFMRSCVHVGMAAVCYDATRLETASATGAQKPDRCFTSNVGVSINTSVRGQNQGISKRSSSFLSTLYSAPTHAKRGSIVFVPITGRRSAHLLYRCRAHPFRHFDLVDISVQSRRFYDALALRTTLPFMASFKPRRLTRDHIVSAGATGQ